MAVRPVVRYPDPVLKRRAGSAGVLTRELRSLAEDLVETMRASPATVGLAAPQIGESVRAFALDVSTHPKATTSHRLIVLFDPEILESAEPEIRREGCLSVPDLTADVLRARQIVVSGRDPDGRRREYRTEGFEARAMLHEIDHLDGALILDRVAASSALFPRRVYR